MPYDRTGKVQRNEDQALLRQLRIRRFPEHEAGRTLRILVLSEAPYAELPEQGLVFIPLYYAGTVMGHPGAL